MSSAEMRPDSCSSASRTRGYRSSVSRSEEHTSELQSPCNLVCRLLLEKKKRIVLLLAAPDSMVTFPAAITFRSAAVVPPTVLFDPPCRMPIASKPKELAADVPARFVPLKFAATTSLAASRVIARRLKFRIDRKSTRLNSSHLVISYAVFCLKKNKCMDNHRAPLVTYQDEVPLCDETPCREYQPFPTSVE